MASPASVDGVDDREAAAAAATAGNTKKTKPKSNKKGPVKQDEDEVDDDLFRVISNPQKMLPNPRRHKGDKKKKKKKRQATSVHSMSSFSDYSSDQQLPSSLGLGSLRSQSSFLAQMHDGSEAYGGSVDDNRPSTSKSRKADIMQEKIEMLTRISKMSKQGYAATKRWSVRDDIDEIRFECYRMTRENNSKRAVKNMQHGLITLATILEFANTLVNPFNLKLQGFSRSMMLTVADYDDSLEAIHHKWSGRTTIGPELTVLFTFATSAVFHHAGNVSNSNAAPPSGQPRTAAPNAGGGVGLGDMSSMLGLFSGLMSKGTQKPSATVDERDPPEQAVRKTRKSMRGPSLPVATMSLA